MPIVRERVLLAKEIVCYECDNERYKKEKPGSDTGSGVQDVSVRYDCKKLVNECNCWEMVRLGQNTISCQCCRICKYVKTKPTTNYLYSSYMDEENSEHDICYLCKRAVFHHYYCSPEYFSNLKKICNDKEEENNSETSLSRSSSSDSISSSISVDSEPNYIYPTQSEDVYLDTKSTSIVKLHERVLKFQLRNLRLRSTEHMNEKREALALKLGRMLTAEEEDGLWKEYIKFNK
jgi:hypothetical protein